MNIQHVPGAEKLIKALLSLETEQECANFFEDICTIKELQDITQRLEVAWMLHEGKNYQEICELTGASTATISRVKKCLVYGNGGYLTVISRLMQEGEAQ